MMSSLMRRVAFAVGGPLVLVGVLHVDGAFGAEAAPSAETPIDIRGGWRLLEYVGNSEAAPPVDGRILFTEDQFNLVYWMPDATGKVGRSGHSVGTYVLDGQELIIEVTFNLSMSGGSAQPGFVVLPAQTARFYPTQKIEHNRVSLDGDRLEIQFYSGNRMVLTRSSELDTPPPAEEPVIPRTSWGDPVFQGFWSNASMAVPAWLAVGSVEFGMDPKTTSFSPNVPVSRFTRSLVVDPLDGKIPYQAWARAKRDERVARAAEDKELEREFVATSGRCYQLGTVGAMVRTPIEVFQYPTHLAFVWEDVHAHRVIWTDGRPALPESIKLWQGHSRGRWEGNTLVVETTNHNGFPWLGSRGGDFYSENLRLLEKFEFVAADTIKYEVEFTDPTVYTRPWRMEWQLHPVGSPKIDPSWIEFYMSQFGAPPGQEVMMEYTCVEARSRD